MAENHESNFRKKHKNDLWTLLNEQGYDDIDAPSPVPIDEFEWHAPRKTDTGWEASVRHIHSGKEFRFSWKGFFDPHSKVVINYSPHPDRPSVSGAAPDWASVLGNFRTWLQALAEETVPDYWDRHRAKVFLRTAFTSDYDTEFTAPEIKQIGESFEAASRELGERRLLPPDELASLTDVFRQQAESAKTTPRIEWQTVAATAIVTHLIERGIDAVTVQSILEVIGSAFTWLNGHIGPTLHQAALLLTGG